MQPQTERIAQLGAALVVMHSPADGRVATDNAPIIFEAARHAKSFVAIDGANHLLTDRNHAAYVAGIIRQGRLGLSNTPTGRRGVGARQLRLLIGAA